MKYESNVSFNRPWPSNFDSIIQYSFLLLDILWKQQTETTRFALKLNMYTYLRCIPEDILAPNQKMTDSVPSLKTLSS